MSLSMVNRQQVGRVLWVLVVALTLLLLGFAVYMTAFNGLEFGTLLELHPGIDCHCTVTACTAVGT